MMHLVLPWLIGAILIGFFGRNFRFGFWGYFFASILLTPIVGLIMLLGAIPKKDMRRAQRR